MLMLLPVTMLLGCSTPQLGMEGHEIHEHATPGTSWSDAGEHQVTVYVAEWSPHNDAAVKLAKDRYRELHPECAVCGVRSNIVNGHQNDVHHILPVSQRPDLAADPNNLVTLCRVHHFVVGHARNWRKYNANVEGSIFLLRWALENTVEPAP